MIESESKSDIKKLFNWYVIVLSTITLIGIVFYLALGLLTEDREIFYKQAILNSIYGEKFYIFIVVGFFAQMIDSSLGMAYGTSTSTFLAATGVHPKLASAAVHISEIFNNAVSAFSHFKMGNIDRKLFFTLLIPGMIGGSLGAYLLTNLDSSKVKPIVATYLLLMGVYIITKAIKGNIKIKEGKMKGTELLALVGAFVNSLGGGGWGPIVTTSLIGSGKHPRKVIGSVNSAKYLIILTASIVFILNISNLFDVFANIAGLIIGGVFAAPLGAFITKRIPVKPAMILVGSVIIILSTYTLYKALFF